MKSAIFIFTLISISFQAYSQELECSCDKAEIAKENKYECDYQSFQNGSRLYWQWNCGSAWLTFENKQKVVLKSCENETIYECQRTGLGFLKEYPNYLLFQYKWISGCCTSPDIIFISKESGKEINRISQDQFVWGDLEKDYLLYFSDSCFTSLTLLDHRTEKVYKVEFHANQIDKSIRKNQVLQLTDLFKNIQKTERALSFEFLSEQGRLEQKRIKIE